MNFIFRKKLKLKYGTKEKLKYFNGFIIALGFILQMVVVQDKPMYSVSINGTEVGYVKNKEALEEKVKESVLGKEEKNIDNIDVKTEPQYELKFVDKAIETNEEKIVEIVEQDVEITYKYYEIALKNEQIDSVNTIEEAEELVNKVKEENQEQELELSIIEKYTKNEQEVNTNSVEVAKNDVQEKVTQKLEEEKKQKEEEERINSMPEINGIKLAYVPVTGTISSRYGVSSRIRKSNHTGLDIATKSGTPIKVVASGTVTCASYQGAYGNLVKVSHGNGVETWYAHTSKMYVSVGQKVEAGEVIAAVGSTGNSTGSHLHLEIRVNGQHINPQNYLY